MDVKRVWCLNRDKGFTLAELLIVVAIIAVLVSIAVPVFSNQLEKSREAVDLSNARAAYSDVLNAAMLGDTTATHNGEAIYSGGKYSIKLSPLKQKQDGWSTDIDSVSIGQVPSSKWSPKDPKGEGSCTITFDPASGTVSVAWDAGLGSTYTSWAKSEFADKNKSLTPETSDERVAADIDIMKVVGTEFLGMTKDEIIAATGLNPDHQGRLTNGEGVAIVTYRNQNSTNPQVRGDLSIFEKYGFSGNVGETAPNSFKDSGNRLLFSDYMNSSVEAQIKVGKIKYDSNGKATSVTVWVTPYNSSEPAPEEFREIVVTS